MFPFATETSDGECIGLCQRSGDTAGQPPPSAHSGYMRDLPVHRRKPGVRLDSSLMNTHVLLGF